MQSSEDRVLRCGRCRWIQRTSYASKANRIRTISRRFAFAAEFSLRRLGPSHTIKHLEVSSVTLTCPNCGNDRNFQVKTLQMHVVHLEDSRVEVSEEDRPTVLEVLCDECETALNFEEFEETLRKEVLLTIGAR